MAGNLTFRNPPRQNPRESIESIGAAVKKTFGANLTRLLDNSPYTHEDFCQMLDISPSLLTNYRNGKTLPPVNKLIYIARMFNIELNELIQHDLANTVSSTPQTSIDTHNYPYYCGSYAIHYFNASAPPGQDNRSNDASVDSGVLVIRKEVSVLGSESYPALCVMGLDMRDIALVKGQIDKKSEASTAELADLLTSKHADKYRSIYHGYLSLNGPQAVVHLSKPNSEVTITMQNVALEVNKDSLRCNIGILSSVSHGNYHLPYAQKVVISAVPLTHPINGKERMMANARHLLLGPDEIASYLMAGTPQVDLDPLKEDFVRYIKGIYSVDQNASPLIAGLKDSYKDAHVMCFLEDAQKETVTRNGYRCLKVNDEASDSLYATVCAIAKQQGLWLEGGKK